MGKGNVRRVQVDLDSTGIDSVNEDEVRAIVEAVDQVIATGGRSLVVKILKGSRGRDVLEKKLDKTPVYGALKHLSSEAIQRRLDWMIQNGYFAIEYGYRLPLLVHRPKGLEIAIELVAERWLEEIRKQLANEAPDPSFMNDPQLNRTTQLLFIEKIRQSGDPRFIPFLEAWHDTAFKRLKEPIHSALTVLRGR